MFPANGPSYRAGWNLPPLSDADRKRLSSELPRALAGHSEGLRPATPEQIVTDLTRLSLHFWQADRPANHFKMVIADYVHDLADVPADILQDAIRQIRQTCQWFPKLADIIAITAPALARRRQELDRMRRLAEHVRATPAGTGPRPKFEELPPERKERFDGLMAGLKAKLTTPPEPPSVKFAPGPGVPLPAAPSSETAATYTTGEQAS